ncbi:hypothetical protein MMC24_003474 [Lignoscripta atroalba]|nr:hypothetical protein [Lignoscripta atroalba]
MMKQISSWAVLALAASTASAKTITVNVGRDDGTNELVFIPSTIFALTGDQVKFDFYPRNHSVVQAAFDAPCAPLTNAFYSGYIPSMDGLANTSYVLTINDTTTPLWFYCSQAMHCQSGMVGVINPTNGTTNDQTSFARAASNATANLAPSTGVSGGLLVSSAGSTDNSSTGGTTSGTTGTESGTSTATGSAPAATTSTAAADRMAVSGFLGVLGVILGLGFL